jgi:uncharacterized protein (TIGR03083 family)
MSDSVWPTIHAERRALIADLTELSAAQWQSSSLCTGWTVHDVLSHLLSLAKMNPPRFLTRFAAAGFNFDRYAGNQIARERLPRPRDTLGAFAGVAGRTAAPPGPKESWLGEAFVHGEDIRRPLGIVRSYPLEAVVVALEFYARSNLIIGSRDRIAGLRLNAEDAGHQIGDGPEVRGPAISLLLVAAGRPVALADLEGPGLPLLTSRC